MHESEPEVLQRMGEWMENRQTEKVPLLIVYSENGLLNAKFPEPAYEIYKMRGFLTVLLEDMKLRALHDLEDVPDDDSLSR